MGDMNILGPRPVRASIAERCQASIPGYERRFDVKPGLVGYTQALMPHSADKVIRARLNATLCRREVRLARELVFVGLTGFSVLAWTGRVIGSTIAAALPAGWLLDHARSCGEARIGNERSGFTAAVRIRRVEASLLHVEADQPLHLPPTPQTVVLRSSCGPCRRTRTARCSAIQLPGEQTIRSAGGTAYRYMLRYTANSPFQRYLIDRYFVGCVLVR
jgi:hypothetical protein